MISQQIDTNNNKNTLLTTLAIDKNNNRHLKLIALGW
jgi:predicted outer membrane protein